MSRSVTKFSLLLSLLSLTSAIPNVTVVPATGGCSDYPAYDVTTGIAGQWSLILSSSENPAIESFGDNSQTVGLNEGRISIASVNDQAKNAVRCNDNPSTKLESLTSNGVSTAAWNQINITEYPYDAEIMWGLGQYSTPLTAFYHFVDGAQQEGLFLGQDNVTTWGVKLYPADEGSLDGESYWSLRLLGPDSALPWNGSALYPDEYRTFLKVYGS